MVRTVFTDEDKRNLKVIALELLEIRKLVVELTETLVNADDKKLMKMVNASQDDLKENKVDSYKETLEEQIDIAEKEFRSKRYHNFFCNLESCPEHEPNPSFLWKEIIHSLNNHVKNTNKLFL